MTEEQWNQMMNVNLKSTFSVLNPTFAQMRKQGYGRVIITSSIAASITAHPGWEHYGSAAVFWASDQAGYVTGTNAYCGRRSAAFQVTRGCEIGRAHV